MLVRRTVTSLLLLLLLQVWDCSARHMMDVVDIAFRYAPGTF